jgi:hypothetical protein
MLPNPDHNTTLLNLSRSITLRNLRLTNLRHRLRAASRLSTPVDSPRSMLAGLMQ